MEAILNLDRNKQYSEAILRQDGLRFNFKPAYKIKGKQFYEIGDLKIPISRCFSEDELKFI